jgi:adenosine deaminase
MIDETFLRAPPKVELHCHLEGAVPVDTFLDLSARHKVVLPTRDPDHAYDFTSFLGFLDLYYLVCESVRDAADFERAVYDSLAHGVRTGNVRYREMFFSPTNHTYVDYPTMVAGLTAGIEAAEADFGVRCRMIADINRRQSPAVALELVETVLRHASPYVIGIGMDDDEDSGPPELFAEAYAAAGRGGLKRTAHAGEMGSSVNVRTSIEVLGCDRIDHGYAMVHDPAVQALVRDSGVHVTGAWFVNTFHAGVFTDGVDPASTPLATMLRAGLPVSLSTDDPTMIPTDLVTEYGNAAAALGWTRDDVVRVAANAIDGAWLDEVDKVGLRKELDAAAR